MPVTPMDMALAGFRLWRLQTQTLALLSLRASALAEDMLGPETAQTRRTLSRSQL